MECNKNAMVLHLLIDGRPAALWEICNMNDPVTLVWPDFDIAAGATFMLGRGNYGLNEILEDGRVGRQMPVFFMKRLPFVARWLRESFPEKRLSKGDSEAVDEFLDSLPRAELARCLRTAQVCPPKDRRAYQAALQAITEPDALANYRHWWKAERLSSLTDITGNAWRMADQLEALERESALAGNRA